MRPGGETTWRRLMRNRFAAAALLFVAFLLIVAISAELIANSRPILYRDADGIHLGAWDESLSRSRVQEITPLVSAPVPFSPDDIDLLQRLAAPTRTHLLGTDDLGRDILARLIYGTRISIMVGLVATAIALLIGVTLGAIAGYYGGAADWIVSRVIEVVLCFPFLFLVLAIVALVRPSVWVIITALGITSWTSEARFVRGEFLRVREMDFARAAIASGAGDARIIFRHLLPNAIAPVLVSASFGVASAVLVESALSFLGFGVPPPAASWGSILSSADDYITRAWWLALFPGIAIFLTVSAYNFIGEALRDALDPGAGA